MKKYATIFIYSLVTNFIWNISVFIGSIVSASDEPNLLMSVVAGIFSLIFTFLFSRFVKINLTISPLLLAIIATAFTLIVNLFITIPNQTTALFFGNWSVYITFLGVGLGTYLGKTFIKN